MRRMYSWLFLALLSPSIVTPSLAAPSQDAQVIVNALKYVRGLELTDRKISIGILYDETIPATRKQAEQFAAEIHRSPAPASGKLTVRLISLAKLTDTEKVTLLHVPSGVERYYAEIEHFARAHRAFVIGMESGCVRQKICTMSVQTDNGIEIYLNDEALHMAGFDVDAAFRFMTKRL